CADTDSSGIAIAPRARQKSQPVMPSVTASAAPNSLVSHAVGPVFTVTRSKKACTNRLCDACRIAAGHTLPERRRSQAIGNEIATTMMAKQSTAYQLGVPEL